MRILRVRIANWRSIKYADFYPSDMTVLVGANNAGKTNILSAINFLIGDRWPMPGNLEDRDFYKSDRNGRIEICLDFENAPYSRLDFDTARSQYTLQAYDANGSPARGFNNDQRARLAFAYVDAGRNFEREFGSSRYSIFGQAIRMLHDDLRQCGGAALPELRKTLDRAHELLRTDLYKSFEEALRAAFTAELRTSRYDVQFEFRTLDETNLYRSLYPMLIERGQPRAPGEAGSGVRNLLVLALFHAFAKSFRGGAIMGIEEPELYLHPHAQRSLMGQFEELVAAGHQIFLSSHNATFLDITRPDRIVIVRQCEDDEDEICTQVSTTSLEDFRHSRQQLHPDKQMTVDSVRAFLRNVRTTEMAEPYFARLVIVAEGPSEREALPIFCSHLGLNLDEEGVSIVAAGGKTVIDTLVQLYRAHDIQTYVVFDNDENKPPAERQYNNVIARLLGLLPTDLPPATITSTHAVLAGDWERQVKTDVEAETPGLYDRLIAEARNALGVAGGKNKPLIARYVAERLVETDKTPRFVRDMVGELRRRLGLDPPTDTTALAFLDDLWPATKETVEPAQTGSDLDDEIPF